MASIEEKIAGLYLAFFNRAIDKNTLEQYKNESLLDELLAIKTVSSNYKPLDDIAYVETLYVDTLGKAGDKQGIEYWSELLKTMSRSDMLSEFVTAAFDFQRDDAKYNLSEEELNIAQQRHDLFENKVTLSLEFVEKLQDETNVTDFQNIEDDPAYKASIKILSQITQDRQSLETSLELLTQLAKDLPSAIERLNNLETISEISYIVNNSLTLKEGESVTITSDNIFAKSTNPTKLDFTFDVSTLSGGNFQILGVQTNSFTSSDIEDGKLQFIHDGGESSANFSLTLENSINSVIALHSEISFTNINDAATGSVTISGLFVENQLLQTDVSTIVDEDGVGYFSYQWSADGVNIAESTNAEYSLTQNEVGKTVSVIVSYTDAQGTFESLSSIKTAPISKAIQTPQAPYLSMLSDSGLSNSDNITQNNRPIIQGSNAIEGSLISLNSDIDGTLGTTTVLHDGTWSIKSILLSDATHNLKVTATDEFNIQTPMSEALVVLIDTQAPFAATVSTISDDDIINFAESEAGFFVNGTGSYTDTISLSILDLGSTHTTIVNTDGEWSLFIQTESLKEASNSFFITQTDLAGNVSDLTTKKIILDTTADLDNNTKITMTENEITLLEKSLVEFSISGLDSDAKASIVFIDSNLSSIESLITTNGTNTVDLSSLENGSIIASVTIVDTAGNKTTVPNETFTINDTNSLSNINLGLSSLSTYSTPGVSSLASQNYWDISNDKTITYSFNEAIPSDYYSSSSDLTTGWAELNEAQKTAVKIIFNELEELLNISFMQVADTSAQSDGDIQFNIIDTDDNTAGFAYYPGDYQNYYGDVFLSSSFNTEPDNFGLDPGEQGWATIVHELGHALGLEHPFDNENTTLLDSSLDDVNHTVMSYVNHNIVDVFTYTETIEGSSISSLGRYLEPELYSLYDLASLQYIYGINSNTNITDTTYIYSYTDYELNTIWDVGGVDTIDLSDTLGRTTVDLHSGSLNSVDEYSLDEIIALHQAIVDVDGNNFDDFIVEVLTNTQNDNNLYRGEENLAIATGTIIENIKTGSGNDTIIDNEVDNSIETFLGNDTIHLGSGGFDRVDGGEGFDTIIIDLKQNEVSISNILNDGSYNLISVDFGVNFIGIETIQFSDTLWSVT